MALLTTLLTAAFTWAGERMLDASLASIRESLKDKAAKAELVTITATAMEAAVALAPALGEDLRSATFLQDVVAPIVIERLGDPSDVVDREALAEAYFDRFVQPWARNDDADGTLARVFQTERSTLSNALQAFVEALRVGLFASEHWKEVGLHRTVAEVHQRVSTLVELQRRAEGPTVDLATAVADSKAASRDLLEWQRTIRGLFIERSELELLINRIRTEPRGRTLLVGEAGSGKSALLSELTARLHADGMTVFAVKADMIPPDVATADALSRALGLRGDLEAELRMLAQAGPVVLVIDQMDAVSNVMDHSSQRMKLLLRIANSFRTDARFDDGPPVHVVVSSRPFEAAHDGRFQSLNAEDIKLGLPSSEKVQTLLTDLGIDPKSVPEALQETLRRPFALRLFVELIDRGVDVSQVKAADLLTAWLRSANLGDAQRRPTVIAFLERLASAMTETETLWRPADAFDLEWGDAVALAEASGLVLRQDGRLGFSHQSWLDDFQAKAFADGSAIAAFAWDRQDGLFARATVLRALERQRRYDVTAYEAALDLLLGDARTRRHVRHLVVDVMANQDAPTSREVGWAQALLEGDVPLARRAVGKLAPHWPGWRAGLKTLLPKVLRSNDLRWSGARLIQAEALLDAESAISLLREEWSSPDRDLDLFQVASFAKLWSPWIETRVRAVLERHDIQDFAIASYIDELLKTHQVDAAVDLLAAYLAAKPAGQRQRLRLYGLSKLVETAPLKVAERLVPWFISLVSDAEDNAGLRSEFPSSPTLPFDWDHNESDDSIYAALKTALALSAKADPNAVVDLLEKLSAIESDEAQALAADVMAENPPAFANRAHAFLLADARRFSLGEAYRQDETGCGHHVSGWSTQQLISAIVPYLAQDQLISLRQAIDTWDRYRPEAWDGWSAADKKMRLGWVKEARFALLERLPDRLFSARELRQIKEWKAHQPVLTGSGRMMASFVGAPMSKDQMAKATDDQLMGLLDDCPDGSEWGDRRWEKRRHISRSGGAIQVGRELAEMAKDEPPRAIRLVRERLSPERHQYAAGSVVNELAGLDTVDADELVALIHELSSKGFDGESWRRAAAWAFQKIAQRKNGLAAADLELLESWIVDDDEIVRDRTVRRMNLDAANEERNRKDEPKTASAVIFGNRFGGGVGILPQDNYAYLAAMASGVLCREPAERDEWLGILERHVDRADDPHIWEALLLYHGPTLFWANRERTLELFGRIWQRFPEALTIFAGGRLWAYRAMLPPDVQTGMLARWIEQDGDKGAQAAGEFAMAAKIVGGDDDPLRDFATAMVEGPVSPQRLGCLFASSAAWRHNAGDLRDQAHAILTTFASSAVEDEAEALSTSLDGSRTLLPDRATREMLGAALANDAIFSAALTSWFADALQELLLHPGFEDIVLAVAERAVDKLIGREGGSRRGMIDGDFVSIAIALQRAHGSQRARAMNLYERLLDAEVYGASEAAAAALRH